MIEIISDANLLQIFHQLTKSMYHVITHVFLRHDSSEHDLPFFQSGTTKYLDGNGESTKMPSNCVGSETESKLAILVFVWAIELSRELFTHGVRDYRSMLIEQQKMNINKVLLLVSTYILMMTLNSQQCMPFRKLSTKAVHSDQLNLSRK